MKQYLKPLVILLPAILVIGYYLVYLTNRSEFPEQVDSQQQVVKPFEKLSIESIKDWRGSSLQVAGATEPVVILHFWASWCAPCIHEFPELIQFAKSMKGKVQVFAISEDKDMEEVKAFMKSFKDAEVVENFHIALDENHGIMNSWGVDKLPESYIFNSDRVLLKHVGSAVPWLSQDSTDFFKSVLAEKKK
jgi:cytochrome c biogenesis protein CcmG/thiol:disulfide interchange protein DsbE